MKPYDNYTVVAASSQGILAVQGCSYHNEWNTLKEAKASAKYILTEQFNREHACDLGYSQVIENRTGNVVADYWSD